MELNKEQIKHIAKLARLELSEQELETYGQQLSAVLDYIDQLREVDVAGVEPTAQVTGLTNVWREDQVLNCPEDVKSAALKLAPETEDGQIKVKRVLE